jgi:hypothetical protein
MCLCKLPFSLNLLPHISHSTLNNRSHTRDGLQSFDVFGKHLTTSDLFQNYDGKDTCDKPYTYDICGKG